MSSASHSDDQIARIERRLSDIQQLIEHQAIAIAHLQDQIDESNRKGDWYNVQFSEMVRILLRDVRELRASLICSVISDGPINAQILKTLLRQTPEDEDDLEVWRQPPGHCRMNNSQ
jgi:hypothetical protein